MNNTDIITPEQRPARVLNLPTMPTSADSDNAHGLIKIIDRLTQNPDMPIEKIQQLLDMQLGIMDRVAEQAFNAAMAATQAEMPVVKKDGYNEHTKSHYAKLGAICEAAAPIYGKHGLSLTFNEGTSPLPDHKLILCEARHTQGFKKLYHLNVPTDFGGMRGNANKTGTQAMGSTVSYGRRYLTCMIFNIATQDDDDGNASGSEGDNYFPAQTTEATQQQAAGDPIRELSFPDQLKAAKTINDLNTVMKKVGDDAARKQYMELYQSVRRKLQKAGN